MSTETFNLLLGICVLVGQIGALLLVIIHATWRTSRDLRIVQWLHTHTLDLALGVSAVAFAGPLVYSEVIGYTPCKLCIWQRIFIFPQLILMAIAWIKKDHRIWIYSVPLAVIGMGISIYHYLIQMGAAESAGCEIVGQSASCAGAFVLEFGYITIPMMALTVGALLVLLLTLHTRSLRD